jgi:hypothetical protein
MKCFFDDLFIIAGAAIQAELKCIGHSLYRCDLCFLSFFSISWHYFVQGYLCDSTVTHCFGYAPGIPTGEPSRTHEILNLLFLCEHAWCIIRGFWFWAFNGGLYSSRWAAINRFLVLLMMNSIRNHDEIKIDRLTPFCLLFFGGWLGMISLTTMSSSATSSAVWMLVHKRLVVGCPLSQELSIHLLTAFCREWTSFHFCRHKCPAMPTLAIAFSAGTIWKMSIFEFCKFRRNLSIWWCH